MIVDIARPYVNKAKRRGFKAIVGDAEKVDLGKKFDIIILSSVLEHVLGPEKLLLNVKKTHEKWGPYFYSRALQGKS